MLVKYKGARPSKNRPSHRLVQPLQRHRNLRPHKPFELGLPKLDRLVERFTLLGALRAILSHPERPPGRSLNRRPDPRLRRSSASVSPNRLSCGCAATIFWIFGCAVLKQLRISAMSCDMVSAERRCLVSVSARPPSSAKKFGTAGRKRLVPLPWLPLWFLIPR